MDFRKKFIYNAFIDISRYNNTYRAKHASTSISNIHDQQDYTHGKQIRVNVFLNTIISLNKYSTIFNLCWRRRTLEIINNYVIIHT